MLKAKLARFVISSVLVLGSLGAAAQSRETRHAPKHVSAKHALGLDPRVNPAGRQGQASTGESAAFSVDIGSLRQPISMENAVDEQNFELEDSIDRELELFRSAQVSLQKALLIAERLYPGSRVVDISFDGASNPPVYRVKNIQKDQLWEDSIDARTGISSAGGKRPVLVKDLEAQDRRNLLALRAVRQELSDAVVVAERSTRGKAISGGLMNEDGTLYFVVVMDTADGLKQVLLEPPRVRGR